MVCCLAASGCYSGFSVDDVGPALDSGADSGSAGDDGDDPEGGTDSDGGDPAGADLDPTRVWRLSASQYERTVEVALGIEVDLPRIAFNSRVDDFINYADGSGVDEVFFANLEEDLFAVTSENIETIGAALPCGLDALDEACLTEFMGPFVRRAHRTDLTPVEPYVQLFAALEPTQGPREAFASSVVAVLLSPKAFFRTQLGGEDTDVAGLTPYELAEYLSYMVWNGPPDEALLDAAADGSLADPAVYEAHLDRMLEAADGNRGMVEFLSQWLGLTGLLGLDKNPTAYPEYDEALRVSMLESTHELFEYVLDEQDADFHTLLTTNVAFVDDRLAALYGVEAPAFDGMPVELPPEQRRGIFTHPAVVVAMSDAAGTAVMFRGKALLRRMLCQELPPRPAGVEPTPPPGIPDDATTREKLESLEETVPCNACHISMHPFAFAMEQYDGIGRFRELENDKTIDASGQLLLATSPDPITFGNARELIDALAERDEIYDCLVQQGIRYTAGRLENETDDADRDRLIEAFRETHDIRLLFRELVLSAAFRDRAKESDDACISP